MDTARIQTYAIWIIFGFVVSYSLENIVQILTELMVFAAIELDLNPALVKYSKTGIKGLLIILIILIALRLIGRKKIGNEYESIKPPRKAFIYLLIVGLLASVFYELIRTTRITKMEAYLESHDIDVMDFYPDFYLASTIPNILIIIALVATYFILTQKKINTNANPKN